MTACTQPTSLPLPYFLPPLPLRLNPVLLPLLLLLLLLQLLRLPQL